MRAHLRRFGFAFVFQQALLLELSLVTRKPVCEVCDQLDTNRPAQLQRLVRVFGYIASRNTKLSRQRTTKALTRRRGCAGCFAPLLFAHGINMFSHDVAQIFKHFK